MRKQSLNVTLWLVLVLVICGLVAIKCIGSRNFVRFSEAKIRRFGPDGRKMPSNSSSRFTYQVESSEVFSLDGQQFRLLGIRESTNDERRHEAMKFMEGWLADAQTNVVWFSNWSQALQDSRGTWVVWVRAIRGGQLHCLNIDLINAGLADVDYTEHLNYEFREPEYGGLGKFVPWRELLDKASK